MITFGELVAMAAFSVVAVDTLVAIYTKYTAKKAEE